MIRKDQIESLMERGLIIGMGSEDGIVYNAMLPDGTIIPNEDIASVFEEEIDA